MKSTRLTACALVLASLAAGLAGCRTSAPRPVIGPGADAPWSEQLAALENLDRYALNGRVAVAANGQGFSASLRYTQLPRRTEFSLDGPLGIGGLRVEVEGEQVAIATSRGERLDGPAARAELERRLGFALPLENLRWWLLGVPAPGEASVNTNDSGEIRDFTQRDWHVSIDSRAAGMGFLLPRRLTAQRTGPGGEGARLKLLIEKWH